MSLVTPHQFPLEPFGSHPWVQYIFFHLQDALRCTGYHPHNTSGPFKPLLLVPACQVPEGAPDTHSQDNFPVSNMFWIHQRLLCGNGQCFTCTQHYPTCMYLDDPAQHHSMPCLMGKPQRWYEYIKISNLHHIMHRFTLLWYIINNCMYYPLDATFFHYFMDSPWLNIL